jgi:hypothetical protein
MHFIDTEKTCSEKKSFETRNYSNDALRNFQGALANLNWLNVLNTNDTQAAYNSFSDTFLTLHDIYFPILTKKFNKNIHKIDPWMTQGILVSRLNKNKLCRQSLASPMDINTKLYLKLTAICITKQ